MSIIQPVIASQISARRGGPQKKLLLLGDSLMAQAETPADAGGDIDMNSNAHGVVNWFNVLADWPFQYYVRPVDNTPDAAATIGWNKGVSGDTIALIKARLVADVLPYHADVVWLSTGGNDAVALTTVANFKQDFLTVANTILDSGSTLIVDLQHNRTSWSNGNSEPLLMSYNRVIREFAQATPGVILNDTMLAMTDYSNADGDPLAAYVSDAVHYTAKGAHAVAKKLVAQLGGRTSGIFPGHNILPNNSKDLYDATYNPYGIINPNPLFYGTGGTAGANVTGTIPDDMQVLTDNANVSAAVSIVAAPTDAPWMAGKWMKVDVTSTGSGSANTRVRIYRTGSTKMSTNYTVGDYYEAVCGVKVDAPGSNDIMEEFGLKLQTGAGSAVVSLKAASGQFMPSEAWFGMLKTQPLQADAASDGFYHQINVEFDGRVAGTQTFYVGQFGFYKMAEVPGF